MTNNQPLRIGFVGLGAMGSGMAGSLLRAGFAVTGYDVRAEAVAAFEESGGTGAGSPAEAADGADVLIIMVLNAEQADDVLFESGQAAAALPQRSTDRPIVMLCSTVQPAYARATAARLEEMGLEMLDAPVSGGTIRAGDGTLSVMASGKPAVFERVQPVLDAVAGEVHRMGDEPGLGATMKLVNQVLAGVNLATAAEAMAFGARAGIDPQQILEVISSSAGNSWMFGNRMPHVLDDDYTPHSAVDIWIKDLGLVLDAAKENNLPLPLSATAFQLFMSASASGYGKLDDAAIIKVYEKMADFSVIQK